MPIFLLGRRQFALGAAAAATTALISKGNALPIDTLASAVAGEGQSLEAQTLEQKTRAAMAKLSARAQAEVEMKVASIFRKYGESQEGLEKMRAFKLENGDQPADAFRAYRSEAKAAAARENAATKPRQAKQQKENK